MNPPHDLDASVRNAQAGDARAFNRLVEAHQGFCYALARQRLRDDDAALEVCQQAMLQAWEAMARFQGGAGDFRGWLARIVINAGYDRLRRERRRPEVVPLHPEDREEPLPLPDPGESPEAYALRADLSALLDRCLAALSDEHRTIILLDQAGFDYQEIGRALDLELGTVKSRLSRARARARDFLVGVGEPRAAAGRSRTMAPQAPDDLRPAPGDHP
jgi:RNA polymerase sigma-70 factor (ECF subfamily)